LYKTSVREDLISGSRILREHQKLRAFLKKVTLVAKIVEENEFLETRCFRRHGAGKSKELTKTVTLNATIRNITDY